MMMLKPVKLQNSIAINMTLMMTAKEAELKQLFFYFHGNQFLK